MGGGSACKRLKELRNFILCIIRVWLLFWPVQVYVSLHFLPNSVSKTKFSSFCVLFFYVFISLVFSF